MGEYSKSGKHPVHYGDMGGCNDTQGEVWQTEPSFSNGQVAFVTTPLFPVTDCLSRRQEIGKFQSGRPVNLQGITNVTGTWLVPNVTLASILTIPMQLLLTALPSRLGKQGAKDLTSTLPRGLAANWPLSASSLEHLSAKA